MLSVLILQLGILKEIKTDYMISCSVIHLQAHFHILKGCKLKCSSRHLYNVLLEFLHVCWNIRSCWVWILRNCCNCDNPWWSKNLRNWRVQFTWGNNSKGCSSTLLILMGFDMLGEMVTSHKSFGTLWAFKPFLTYWKKLWELLNHYFFLQMLCGNSLAATGGKVPLILTDLYLT